MKGAVSAQNVVQCPRQDKGDAGKEKFFQDEKVIELPFRQVKAFFTKQTEKDWVSNQTCVAMNPWLIEGGLSQKSKGTEKEISKSF